MTPLEQQLRQHLQNPNARGFMGVLSRSEGTAGFSNPYMAMGGTSGKLLTTKTDAHPYVYGQGIWKFKDKDGKVHTSTSNGRYMFNQGTYADMGRYLGRKLTFSPEDQDLAVLAMLHKKGVLNDVVNGQNWDNTFNKLGSTWVSLHTAPDSVKQFKHGADKIKQFMAAEGIKGYEQYAQQPTQAQQAVSMGDISPVQQPNTDTLGSLVQTVFTPPKVENIAPTDTEMRAPQMPTAFTGWQNYYK